MRRREFIASAAATATVWPLAAHAQRSGAMRRIAVVGALAPDDVEVVARSAAFEQGLAALGWTKGGTIAIDYHWVGNDSALAQKTAAEVVALAPDVILASSNIVIERLSKATGTIPIVMVQAVDPVGSGYVYPVPHRRKKSESQRANAQPTSDAGLSGTRFGGVRGSLRACGIERRSKRQGDYLAAGKSPMASRGPCRSERPFGEI